MIAKRALLVSSIAVVTALVPASTSGAASKISVGGATVRATIDTPAIRPDTRRVTSTLTIRTGAHSLKRWLTVTTPRFARKVQDLPVIENAPASLLGLKSSEGPWSTTSEFGGETHSVAICRDSPVRGGLPEDYSWKFSIPAQSTVRLTFGFAVSHVAPWADSSYTPRFAFSKRVKSVYDVPLGDIAVSPRRPKIARPIATRVDLDFSPRITLTRPPLTFSVFEVGVGTPPLLGIGGRIVPAAAGRSVTVLQRIGLANNFSVVGSAVTDASGAFWLPAQWSRPNDSATLKAVLAPKKSGAKPEDSSCPVDFESVGA
jgi:hypothetical protein